MRSVTREIKQSPGKNKRTKLPRWPGSPEFAKILQLKGFLNFRRFWQSWQFWQSPRGSPVGMKQVKGIDGIFRTQMAKRELLLSGGHPLRGGMILAATQRAFSYRSLGMTIFEMPDGKLEQFLVIADSQEIAKIARIAKIAGIEKSFHSNNFGNFGNPGDPGNFPLAPRRQPSSPGVMPLCRRRRISANSCPAPLDSRWEPVRWE